MTEFKICVSILTLATLMSCSADELTLDEIVNHPVAFEKQEVALDSAKFSLMNHV